VVILEIVAGVLALAGFITGYTNLPEIVRYFRRLANPSAPILCDNKFAVEADYSHFTWTGKGAGTCTAYLSSGEFIVGIADSGFQASVLPNTQSSHCAAYALIGPLEITFSIDKGGGGDFYSSTDYQSSFLQEKYYELSNQVNCNMNVRNYDKIECTESGCRILP
jgi:hypothetical protein